MIKTVFGKKVGMTTWYDEMGVRTPVTVVEVLPLKVVQIKESAKEGYNALVVGFLPLEERKVNKPRSGVFKKIGMAPMRKLREIRVDSVSEYKVGQDIGIDSLGGVDFVNVSGTTKGRGFTGVIKRYHFQRGRETHGNKMHREGGSIGNRTDPAKVWKGKKMAGHHGNSIVTTKNIRVVKLIPEKGVILLKGSIPGANNRVVDIRKV